MVDLVTCHKRLLRSNRCLLDSVTVTRADNLEVPVTPGMNTQKRENPKAERLWFSPATTVYTVITGTLKLAVTRYCVTEPAG